MASCLPCLADVDTDAAGGAAAPAPRRSRHGEACSALLGLLFGWPTAVTVVWALTCLARSRHGEARGAWLPLAWEALLFELALRASRAAALLLHELAHLAAASALLLPRAKLRLLPPASSGAHAGAARLAGRLASQLLPFAAAPGACVSLTPRARKALLARGEGAEALVRTAGLAFSLLLPCGLWVCLGARLHAGDPAAASVLAGAVLVAAGSLLSDLPGGLPWGLAPPAGCFCCGNWGLLVPRSKLKDGNTSKELFPGVCETLLLSVLDIVEMRGAQAGGVNTFLNYGGDQVTSVRARTLKTKRGRLGTKIFDLFRSRLQWKYRFGLLRCKELKGMPVVLAQGHSRFGTSSAPAEIETHPHQWLGPRMENVWQCDQDGMWKCRLTEVCTTITHNGDFDGWTIFDKVVPNGDLGHFLERLLHCNNDAKGDSPKMAGMIDLLLCQGMWLPSVRLAYVTEVMKHADEVFGWEEPSRGAPNMAPPHTSFAQWASVFDGFLREALARGTVSTRGKDGFFRQRPAEGGRFVPTQENVQGLADALVEFFERPINAEDLRHHGVVGDHLKNFVARACEYFFCMDLLSTVQCFFQRAEGTFGVSVSCTLWPTSIVLASKGQPISLAIDPGRPLVFWSSEPSSLQVGWPVPDSRGMRTRAARARWDLNDAKGEALELRIMQGGTADEHLGKLRDLVNPGKLADSHFFPMPGLEADRVMDYHLLIRGVSLDSACRPLSYDAFVARWVRLTTPPTRRLLGSKEQRGLDPVARDLNDVPCVLQQVEDSWSDRTALNNQSGRRFGRCLSELLARKRQDDGASDTIDVLVFGIENSLWLGQQFAADLKKVMPMLNITALSSNWVLGMMQETHGHLEPRNFAISRLSFRFTPGAVVLGVSHSGTTYPTVWAARALHRLHGKRTNIFAMSSVFDTVLANSIGQDLMKIEFAGCLFSTMAGQRPSEPSTVATLAMHHTLSWLLYVSVKTVSAAFPRERTTASGAKPRARLGAAAGSSLRGAAEEGSSRPWIGKWVDRTTGFFHGATIIIEESSWHLEGPVDHTHHKSSFSIGASSEDGVRLIESFQDGSMHAFDATCRDGCIVVVFSGAFSAGADFEGSLQEPGEKQEWVLHNSSPKEATLPVLTLGASDVRDMPHLLKSLLPAAEELCGVSRTGLAAQKPSEVRRSVLFVGKYLASHLLEGWYSLLLASMYVYITVTVGYALLSGSWARIEDAVGFYEPEEEEEWWWTAIRYVVAHLDAHIYVFMGAFLATAHRLCTGRRLFVRYCGKSLVIVDCTVNYKLLRAYVSKLRALSFRFTTFGVSGQNGEDHFVHEMTHLTTSEVVIFAGRTDGRLGTLASAEAASIMSLQQARFIAASPYTGVEVVSVAHNPWTKPGLFARSVTLSSKHRPGFYSQELLRSATGGHSPADVMHGVAMLAKGDLSSASSRRGGGAPFQELRIEDIQRCMVSTTLDTEEAQNVIIELVDEHSSALGIDPEEFCVSEVLNADVAAHLASMHVHNVQSNKDSSHSSLSRRGFSAFNAALSKLGPGSPSKRDPTHSDIPSAELQRKFRFTASNLMAVLRGNQMEKVISQMQVNRQKRASPLFAEFAKSCFGDTGGNALKGCFEAWADFASERSGARAERVTEYMAKVEADREKAAAAGMPPQTVAWRTQEEYRQRRNQWHMRYSWLPLAMNPARVCFDSWKEVVGAAKAGDEGKSLAKKALANFSPSKIYSEGVHSPAGKTSSSLRAGSKGTAFSHNSGVHSPAGKNVSGLWRGPSFSRQCSPSGSSRGDGPTDQAQAFSRKSSPGDKKSFIRQSSPGGSENSPHNSKQWDSVVKKVMMESDGGGEERGPVVIGEERGSKIHKSTGASSKDLIAELGYMEGIYETRIAAAERLLAFYILFHSAVRPLSRLWGLSFDMDRSESRLRVASTPAPVPFVESLDAEGPAELADH